MSVCASGCVCCVCLCKCECVSASGSVFSSGVSLSRCHLGLETRVRVEWAFGTPAKSVSVVPVVPRRTPLFSSLFMRSLG